MALSATIGAAGCVQLVFLSFSGTRYARPVRISLDPEIRKLFCTDDWNGAGLVAALRVRYEKSRRDPRIEALISDRNEAKRARDFARADAIRKQLTDAGVLLEDTKDGVRWKRK